VIIGQDVAVLGDDDTGADAVFGRGHHSLVSAAELIAKELAKEGIIRQANVGFLAGDADLDFDDAGDDFFDNRGEAGGDFDIIGQRPIIDDKANGFGLRDLVAGMNREDHGASAGQD
jgi:hypothetical protein